MRVDWSSATSATISARISFIRQRDRRRDRGGLSIHELTRLITHLATARTREEATRDTVACGASPTVSKGLKAKERRLLERSRLASVARGQSAARTVSRHGYLRKTA